MELLQFGPMSDVQRRSYSPNIAKENLLNVCLALVTELRGFMPACPARLRLLSGSCSSAHSFAPRFLHAGLTERRSAVCFARYDQLAGGLPPPSRRPCWAHMKEARQLRRPSYWNTAKISCQSDQTKATITANEQIRMSRLKVIACSNTQLGRSSIQIRPLAISN